MRHFLDKLTLARSDGTFYDAPTTDIKIMGDAYPFYTEGDGVECYVLVAEPREDWLPDYAAARIVYWIDKHYSYPLRIEQYDSEGQIISVLFSVTKDLTKANPATGLRAHGFSDTPLFCLQEADIEGAEPRIVRVLLTRS